MTTPSDPGATIAQLIQQWRSNAEVRRRHANERFNGADSPKHLIQASTFDRCADELEAVLRASSGSPQPPPEARTDLDMLQVDRLRAWARNIREYGPDITQWGSPAFVAEECERIAADVERSIKRWSPTCAPDCVDCADEAAPPAPAPRPPTE